MLSLLYWYTLTKSYSPVKNSFPGPYSPVKNPFPGPYSPVENSFPGPYSPILIPRLKTRSPVKTNSPALIPGKKLVPRPLFPGQKPVPRPLFPAKKLVPQGLSPVPFSWICHNSAMRSKKFQQNPLNYKDKIFNKHMPLIFQSYIYTY